MAQTMSQFQINAMLDWQRETEARQQRIDEAIQLEGEDYEAFIQRSEGLPKPRTWLEYAIDPLGDGSPKSPDSEAPGMLDAADPLNADSLLLDPAWAQKTPGTDFETVYFYKQAQEGRSNTINSIRESIYPSVVSKTAAADFVPDMFNIFQKKDGSKFEGNHVDSFWMRSAFHGAGLGWNILATAAAAFVGISVASHAIKKGLPAITGGLSASAVEIVDEGLDARND